MSRPDLTSPAAESTRRAGRREWVGLGLLALPAVLVSMDMTVLHLAVPSLSADLRPSSSQLLWIVDIYGFMIAGFLITMGTLGDRIGRRKLLLVGAAAFGVASVLAAFSTTAWMLIAARMLLGVAGATLAPSTLALIRNMFRDPGQRTTAISMWFMSFLTGAAVGPLVGGALLEYFWWGSAFLIGVPVMALLLAAGPFLLPEYRDPTAGRLDLASAAMSLAAVLAVIYGLKQVAADGLALPPILVIAAGVATAVVFVRRQRTLSDPLLDLTLLGERTFSVSLGVLTLAAAVMGGVGYLTAQYLQLVLGLSPLQAGLWMLPPLGAGIVLMMVAPLLVRRVRPGLVIGAGLALAAAGFVVVSQVGDNAGLPIVITGTAMVFAGLMPVAALGMDVVINAVAPQRTGAASAISETTQELGFALGIALLGSLGTAIYRRQMNDAIPADSPAQAADTARDTLGGATGVADQLPAGLLVTAGQAYTDGLQAAAAASAVALAAAAVVAATLLRRTPTRSGQEPLTATPDDEASPGLTSTGSDPHGSRSTGVAAGSTSPTRTATVDG